MKNLVIALALALSACVTHVTGPKGPNALNGGPGAPPTCSISTSPGATCPPPTCGVTCP